MQNARPISEFPELFFGLAGPIGTDIGAVSQALTERLELRGYTPHPIKITEKLLEIEDEALPTELQGKDRSQKGFFSKTLFKINFANQLCSVLNDSSVMASIAIDAIRDQRKALVGDYDKESERSAFIIHQLKRPTEVELLRGIYGPRFFLISAMAPRETRSKALRDRIRLESPTRTDETTLANHVETLLNRDYNEDSSAFGQQLRDTFHLADLFVDTVDLQILRSTINRFVDLLFGKNDITPNKREYGMYMAKSASLRSADLSRQVGAAIFSDDGELITQGCNEVPKALGGTYWDGEEPDYRDIKLTFDPNERQKKEIVRDILYRLNDAGLFKKDTADRPIDIEVLTTQTLEKNTDINDKIKGCLRDSFVMDLTEYGRVVHAEMVAVCDAARLGRPIKGSTLYCTTFPCHNCTKHILASGIKRVIYIEPYPKSKALDLHGNEVSLEEEKFNRVSFVPFTGVSPMRYRSLFQKGRRKGRDGSANEWYFGTPKPYVDATLPTYLKLEATQIYLLSNKIEKT